MGNLAGGLAGLVMMLSFLFILIVTMRFVGAWMFRINDVIRNQNRIIDELKKLNNKDNSVQG